MNNIWVCPNCDHPNPRGSRYCEECREPLTRVCPDSECHHEQFVMTKYCGQCGRSSSEAEEIGKSRTMVRKWRFDFYSLLLPCMGLVSFAFILILIDQDTRPWRMVLRWPAILFNVLGESLLSGMFSISSDTYWDWMLSKHHIDWISYGIQGMIWLILIFGLEQKGWWWSDKERRGLKQWLVGVSIVLLMTITGVLYYFTPDDSNVGSFMFYLYCFSSYGFLIWCLYLIPPFRWLLRRIF